MSGHRSLRLIRAELDAARASFFGLQAEHEAALAARREGIVAAFDQGATRAQLMEEFDATYQYVANVLSKAGRNERQRGAIRAARYDAAVVRIEAERGATP
jgi:hypothetical protein